MLPEAARTRLRRSPRQPQRRRDRPRPPARRLGRPHPAHRHPRAASPRRPLRGGEPVHRRGAWHRDGDRALL